ncbi:MAG: hypothetical protein JWP97_6101 [Labilithrix sp.]|nr:hypothetical protein [Labilithrix sp.]
MLRPFRTYAALARADDEHGRPTVVVGMARLAFVTGAFVALTATGRLAPFELVSGMISFAYVPVLHFLSVAAATRLADRRIDPRRAYALYAEGYGPWFLLMLGIVGGSLFVHQPARLLSRGSSLLMLATFAWSGTLTFACFRAGLGMTRRRAALALVVHYLVVTALVLAFFLLAGQLLPILPR